MKDLKIKNVSATFETIWHNYISYQLFTPCVSSLTINLGKHRAKHMSYHRGAGQHMTFALQRDMTEDYYYMVQLLNTFQGHHEKENRPRSFPDNTQIRKMKVPLII